VHFVEKRAEPVLKLAVVVVWNEEVAYSVDSLEPECGAL